MNIFGIVFIVFLVIVILANLGAILEIIIGFLLLPFYILLLPFYIVFKILAFLFGGGSSSSSDYSRSYKENFNNTYNDRYNSGYNSYNNYDNRPPYGSSSFNSSSSYNSSYDYDRERREREKREQEEAILANPSKTSYQSVVARNFAYYKSDKLYYDDQIRAELFKLSVAVPNQIFSAMQSIFLRSLRIGGFKDKIGTNLILNLTSAHYKDNHEQDILSTPQFSMNISIQGFFRPTFLASQKHFGLNPDNYYGSLLLSHKDEISLIYGAAIFAENEVIKLDGFKTELLKLLGENARSTIERTAKQLITEFTKYCLSVGSEAYIEPVLKVFINFLEDIDKNANNFGDYTSHPRRVDHLFDYIDCFYYAMAYAKEIMEANAKDRAESERRAREEDNKLNAAYATLGLSKGCSYQEAQEAHRRLIRKWHPDRAPEYREEEYRRKSVEINKAWELLKDELY